ncbi:MAG: glycine cleavage system protein GcvH [Proteobacteria bacterium]|nr:glycine cleavage system protein GcvH [Pseudomonadota bacterium]
MALKFTEDHEWVLLEGDVATIGVSNYAQEQLGDVVFVEVPEVGADLAKGEELAVVESVKAASEVYAPIGGEVIEVNTELEDSPTLVNEEPTGGGWFAKIKVTDSSDLDELMDEAAYKSYVEGLDE